jgi:hypothetical protein
VGVFVLHAAQPGERLLAERPLLEWNQERGDTTEILEAAVESLSLAKRREYWALCQNAEHGRTKNAYGIWLSNALPTEDEPATAAVFRVASRLNHSCRPNAHISWNSHLQRETVHALHQLEPGQEVRIHYRGDSNGESRDERRAGLLADFGFECACLQCAGLDRASQAESDANHARIASLFQAIAASPTPRNVVQLAERRIELLAREGVLTTWDTYGAAMSYLKCTGEAAQAARWAARAAASAAAALGRDSLEFEQFVSEMSGIEREWREAGARLRADGYVVIEGFAGESLSGELRAQLSVLYARATKGTGGNESSGSSNTAEFCRGEIGGGSSGKQDDVRKDSTIRGDHRALIETYDPRAPALAALFFMLDQLVGMLAAKGCVPELCSVTRRSRPMLACYAGGGAKYVRHVDNPDGNGRLLTAVYYLNQGWQASHGGELVLYPRARPKRAPPAASARSGADVERSVRVEPLLDRLVLFWSDGRTPHEVLPASANRLAVSAWYHHDTGVPV